MNFIVSTDSCCDDFKSNFAKNNVSYFGMKYNYNDEEYVDNFDCDEDYLNFYEIQNSGNLVRTSGVNIEEMKDYFTELLKQGKDIVHLSLSSGLSCTYQNTKLAADELNETSEHRIFVIDSLSATIGMNSFVDEMIKCRDNGMTAEETCAKIEEMTNNLGIYFFVNDLDTLKRGGRVSAIAATIGKALQLKPVLSFNEEGRLAVLSKVIGEKKALMTLLNYVSKDCDPDYPIYTVYGENNTLIGALNSMVTEKVEGANIKTHKIGPMIGAHTGPSVIGICYQRKK